MSLSNVWRPYGEGLPPASDGRILLSEMMEDYCADQWSMRPGEVLAAMEGRADPDDVFAIVSTVGFLAGLLRSGRIATFVRPFGGGSPEPFPADRWEIDDPLPRFIASAVNPEHWATPRAAPTNWIFVERAAYKAFMADWCRTDGEADDGMSAVTKSIDPEDPGKPKTDGKSGAAASPAVPTSRPPAPLETPPPTSSAPGAPAARPRNILRLAEVKDRTRLSRSEIYRRMERGTFPRSIKLGTNMTGWYEDGIEDWVASLQN